MLEAIKAQLNAKTKERIARYVELLNKEDNTREEYNEYALLDVRLQRDIKDENGNTISRPSAISGIEVIYGPSPDQKKNIIKSCATDSRIKTESELMFLKSCVEMDLLTGKITASTVCREALSE